MHGYQTLAMFVQRCISCRVGVGRRHETDVSLFWIGLWVAALWAGLYELGSSDNSSDEDFLEVSSVDLERVADRACRWCCTNEPILGTLRLIRMHISFIVCVLHRGD